MANRQLWTHSSNLIRYSDKLRRSACFFKNKYNWWKADTGSRKVMAKNIFIHWSFPGQLRKRWKNDNKNFTCENGGVWLTQDLFINLHRYLRVGQTGAKKRMIHGCFIDTSWVVHEAFMEINIKKTQKNKRVFGTGNLRLRVHQASRGNLLLVPDSLGILKHSVWVKNSTLMAFLE